MSDDEVRHQDWDGRDLSRQSWCGVQFVDVDLTETVDVGAVFDRCTFRDCRFNASQHTDAAFTGCTFTGCSFFDARLDGCKLVGSTFDRCSFDLLRAEGGDWSFVGLIGADLRRARFSGLRMREADLTGCDLRGSDLSSLDTSTVRLLGAVVDLHQAVGIAASLGVEVRSDEPG